MRGLGTIVNIIAIIAGCAIGMLFKKGIPDRYKKTVMQALGLSTVVIGISGVLQGMYVITEEGTLDRAYIILMIGSLAIGAVIGEFFELEKRLDNIGAKLQERFKDSGNVAQAFVTATLVYCIGSMSILGALEDGLNISRDLLYAKSMLDGIASIIFTSSLGIGVIFSIIPVFLYQGSITLFAGIIEPFLSIAIITQMSLVGNVLILAIGINLLEIKKIKVANMLPAIFIPVVIDGVLKVIGLLI